MQKPTIRLKDDQNTWNLIFAVLFAILLGLSVWYFYGTYGLYPRYMPVWDFFLLALAVFRITRLFVYDKITQFMRDAFMRSRELEGEDGQIYVERTSYPGGFLRTISDLLACPWCVGMWATLFVVFFYYTLPFAWYVIAILAVAGVGNIFQLIANTVGWKAEDLKLEVRLKDESDAIKPDGN